MDLRWRDADKATQPGTWESLRLTILDSNHPGLLVEVCHPLCIRVSLSGKPVLWAKIDDDYHGYTLLRRRSVISPGVLPPIRFHLIDDLRCGDASDHPARYWARTYAKMLAESDASPLLDGEWRLTPYRGPGVVGEISTTELQKIIEQKTSGYVEWDFGDYLYPITLKNCSAADSSRVKAWRKQARIGALPPVLLFWISGLDAHVVLDGHDRLLAAFLEDVAAPALSLERVVECSTDEGKQKAVVQQISRSLASADRESRRPHVERLARVTRLLDVEGANTLLLGTFAKKLRTAPTCSFFLEGGFEQWAREVHQECAIQGLEPADIFPLFESSEPG